MALKIRLRQQGRNNRPFYRLVVTDSRSPRDGKYIEMIGWYDPFGVEAEKNVFVKEDRIQHWLDLGAQLSDGVVPLIARAAPQITKKQTEREVARREKTKAQRKARKEAAA